MGTSSVKTFLGFELGKPKQGHTKFYFEAKDLEPILVSAAHSQDAYNTLMLQPISVCNIVGLIKLCCFTDILNTYLFNI